MLLLPHDFLTSPDYLAQPIFLRNLDIPNPAGQAVGQNALNERFIKGNHDDKINSKKVQFP
jgi:hypothetical protein